MLTTTAGKGGNLLLNVGPRADGTVPEATVRVLEEVGRWLDRNGEFLPRSERSPFSWFTSGTTSVRDGTIYLHLFHSPGPELCLAEIANRVTAAREVGTGRELPFEQREGRLFVRGLPVPLADPIATTIAIEVEGEPKALTEQATFWVPE